MNFTYDVLAGRVVFGMGSRHKLADELAALGSRRVLVVASREEDQLAAEVNAILGGLAVGRFDDVTQHVPIAQADAAIVMARDVEADTVVTIGGGSATGFGKIIARTLDVRLIAVPTTYAGSEMTDIWGLTDGDHKQTGKDPRVKPKVVVYDPELTLTLPAHIAGPSGMNAMAHAVEALYGPGANPVVSAMAIEAIAALHTGLPVVVNEPDNLDGRSHVLYGAYLAAVALAGSGTALHHKTCHVLGGMFNLNHGDMNSVVLGHALAYNAPAIPECMARIAGALGVDAPGVPGAMFDLAAAIGAPTSLEAIGMPAEGLDEAARRVVTEAAANVRPPEEGGIRQMLDNAYFGRRPGDPPSTKGTIS
ncbi:MAG: maleylacetate reductase [bacterium]|nr:maleylacetate reductase [bacterium]